MAPPLPRSSLRPCVALRAVLWPKRYLPADAGPGIYSQGLSLGTRVVGTRTRRRCPEVRREGRTSNRSTLRNRTFRYRRIQISGYSDDSCVSETVPHISLKPHEVPVVDGQIPFEVLAHLPLDPIELPRVEHPPCDDDPVFIGERVIVDDFRCEHVGRDEQFVAGLAFADRVQAFETLEKK